MAGKEKDHIPMLSDTDSNAEVELGRFVSRSASVVLPVNVGYDDGNGSSLRTMLPLRGKSARLPVTRPPLPSRILVGNGNTSLSAMGRTDDGGSHAARNDLLLNSGPLAMCNDPYCTSCPAAYHSRVEGQRRNSLDMKLHNILHGDAKGWASKQLSLIKSHFPIMNPHTKFVQRWNSIFVISCLVSIFIDPLFFLVLSVDKVHRCIVFDLRFAIAIAVVRSIADVFYLFHMCLQFRLAYIAPESRVVGAGEFVADSKKIAIRYLSNYFAVDLFGVLPLPQIMVFVVIPKFIGSANYAKNLLRATVLLQYIPKIIRLVPLLGSHSGSGFIFESAWANFIINLLVFVLAGHVVGSCWYLFGLQRVNQCLRDACIRSAIRESCMDFIDCGRGNIEHFKFDTKWQSWLNETSFGNCFQTDTQNFKYGIYQQAVLITTKNSIIVRYIYSLFWGFQQISTLAGNQVPSDFVWEVLFTMGIVGLGLLLFALLVGNIQNFLQSLGRRKLEMQLRRRDFEQWMSHRRLPEDLRNHVREAERFNWAATRGVNEEELLKQLPEDLQRNIRRHLFTFLKKFPLFTSMKEPASDAICERLRQRIYLEKSTILYNGSPIEKMVFIVRGKMESIGENGNVSFLSDGDICGEELLKWYLGPRKDGEKIGYTGQPLISNRTVICLTNVEAFAIHAVDLRDVTAVFASSLKNPHVRGAMRYESPHWRTVAAIRIQNAWRFRKKRSIQSSISSSGSLQADTSVRLR